jgi:hypothetical protein
MKKRLLFCAIAMATVRQVYAQQLKTLKQDYNDGVMRYQYYENPTNGKQVKHGAFSYTKYLNAHPGTYAEVVTGRFKNDYRDGSWSFSIKRVDYPNSGNSYTTETTLANQSFNNGMPDGPWKVSRSWKLRNRLYFKGSFRWGAFDDLHVSSASCTFVNGVANGVVTFSDPKTITLHLNKNGFVTGNYIFAGAYSNSEIAFNQQGVVIKFVDRSKTGTVQTRETFDADVLAAGAKYLNGTMSKEQLDAGRIKADTVSITRFVNYADIFEQDYFIFPGLGGDKSIYDDGFKTVNTRIYGRYIFFERTN